MNRPGAIVGAVFQGAALTIALGITSPKVNSDVGNPTAAGIFSRGDTPGDASDGGTYGVVGAFGTSLTPVGSENVVELVLVPGKAVTIPISGNSANGVADGVISEPDAHSFSTALTVIDIKLPSAAVIRDDVRSDITMK